jgi:hypothetical protein
MTLKEYLSLRLLDPDTTGSSEYRAVHEVVMAAVEDGGDPLLAHAVCGEFMEWAADVRGHIADYERQFLMPPVTYIVPLTLDQYRSLVSGAMVRDYGVTWDAACGDSEPLERALEDGESPEQFVAWWGDKYDMIPKHELGW